MKRARLDGMIRLSGFLICLVLALSASGLSAQDTDYCGMDAAALPANLAGTWTLHQLPGAAIGGVVPVPLSRIEVEAVTIRPNGGGFTMVSRGLNGQIAFQPTPRFDFALPPEVPGFTDNLGNPRNFGAGVDGCAWAQMPRFHGEARFEFGNGTGMDLQFVMHFRSASYGLGMLRFSSTGSGPGFVAARPVVLSRGNA